MQEQLDWLKNEPAGTSHGYNSWSTLFDCGGSASGSAVVMYNFDAVPGGGGAFACAVLAIAAFIRQSAGSDRIPRKIEELESEMTDIQEDIAGMAKDAGIPLF